MTGLRLCAISPHNVWSPLILHTSSSGTTPYRPQDDLKIRFPAEKEGFEPPVHLRVQLISSQSRSTAPALLQVNYETALLTSAAASLSRMADWTFNPLSSINFFASAAFVPWSRTIIGT